MTQDQIVTALLAAARSAVAAALGERAAVVWPLVEPEAGQAAEEAARELLALLAVPEPVERSDVTDPKKLEEILAKKTVHEGLPVNLEGGSLRDSSLWMERRLDALERARPIFVAWGIPQYATTIQFAFRTEDGAYDKVGVDWSKVPDEVPAKQTWNERQREERAAWEQESERQIEQLRANEAREQERIERIKRTGEWLSLDARVRLGVRTGRQAEELKKALADAGLALSDSWEVHDGATSLQASGKPWRDAYRIAAKYRARVKAQLESEARVTAEGSVREPLALLAVPEPVRARVIAGEHTKKKFPIWTVPIERRISGEEFRKAKEKAEEGDGYYSSFRGGGAVVGFVFRDESKANAFAAWLGEEKPDAPEATGPTLAEAKTSNGQISAFALDKRDLYYQRYREQADKVISYLPSGFTMERRDSKHGQIYVFLDSKDRLLTRADYARFGAPEKESAEIEAARAEVEKRQALERARDERIAEAQLESARNWNLNGRKIYELTSDEYEGAMGVDRPYIGEISGLQYSRMSGRARRAYDEKRRGEWARSAGVGSAWRRKVEQLALAGDIDLSTPGLSGEARGVVAQVASLRAAKEAERARAEKARRKELAATAATRQPERALEAENRAKEIRNLVSRGAKRETGAVNVSLSGARGRGRGFVTFPPRRVVDLGITNRDWGLYNTLSGKVYAEGEFTDQDSPESVAQSIYAALRKWDLEHRNPA